MFDYIISNPPYQLDASQGTQNTAHNIFHYFYDYGLQVTTDGLVLMIFPCGRWLQRSSRGGSAADAIYPSVKTIDYYPNGDEKNIVKIFPGVRLTDGLCVVSGDNTVSEHIVHNNEVFSRPKDKDILPLTDKMTSIISKIQENYPENIYKYKQPVTLFDIPTYYAEKNPDMVQLVEDHTELSLSDPIRGYMANDNRGTGKRVVEYWLEKDVIDWDDYRREAFGSYKVCAPQAAVSKTPDYTTYMSIDKDTFIGNSWNVLGLFGTKEEADNYAKYLNSNIVKLLLAESKGGKSKTWGVFVPDLGDYTNSNTHIDWDKPIDPQLEELFGLGE